MCLFSGTDASDINIRKVSPVIFGQRENDLSFISDDTYYFLLECQSSNNPNMPFRLLQYMTTAWYNYLDQDALYSTKLVPIKVPKLYTVFTGCINEAPEQVMSSQRLSDMYEVKQDNPDIEAIVHTYHFQMTPSEAVDYIDHNRIPYRLQEFFSSSLFWETYALTPQ